MLHPAFSIEIVGPYAVVTPASRPRITPSSTTYEVEPKENRCAASIGLQDWVRD
jgi:hypothetical protein